jgi:hypothetical protein
VNEQERKLRDVWAGVSEDVHRIVCNDFRDGAAADLGSAVRAFCESEPGANSVVEPEALLRVREAWAKCDERDRRGLVDWLRWDSYREENAREKLDHALADLLESAPVEGGEDADRLECALGDAKAAMGDLAAVKEHRDKLSAAFERIVPQSVRDQDGTVEGMERWIRDTLAAAEKERDKLKGDHRYACEVLSRTSIELGEAKREAEAMRDLANKNANELNAAQRSYSTQLAELTRALVSEKKAHNEALTCPSRPERAVDLELREAFRCSASWAQPSGRLLGAFQKWLAAPLSAPDAPDEYTRAAVAYAESALDKRQSYDDYLKRLDTFKALYTARQRGEPSAPVVEQEGERVLREAWNAHASKPPVSSQPPARVLECWFAEYESGVMEAAFPSSKEVFEFSDTVLRAHLVALPVLKTVERGQ